MTQQDGGDCPPCNPGTKHDGEQMMPPARARVSVRTLDGGGVQVPRGAAYEVPPPPVGARAGLSMDDTAKPTINAVAQLNNSISRLDVKLTSVANIMINKGYVTRQELDEMAKVVAAERGREEVKAVNLAFMFLTARITEAEITIESLVRVVRNRGLVTEAEFLAALAETNDGFNKAMQEMFPNRQPPPPMGRSQSSDPRGGPR